MVIFFAMDVTLELEKLCYAVVPLKRDAMQWHQSYRKMRGLSMIAFSWSEYVRAITVHSSNALLEDTIEELTILMQTDTSMEYCRWFDVLLNKVIICEEYTISICLRDLKTELRCSVNMF